MREFESALNVSEVASTVAPVNGPDWVTNRSPTASIPARPLPASVGRYRILRLVGEGGPKPVVVAHPPRRVKPTARKPEGPGA